jgi:hypothetical protein
MRVCARGVVLASLLGCRAAEPPRTVSGAFSFVFQKDDGTQTVLAAAGNQAAIAAWALPSGSIGSVVPFLGPGSVRLPASMPYGGGFPDRGGERREPALWLQIPPGFLEKGCTYQFVIDSFQAPWDTLGRAPLRTGVPFATAETVAATFMP